MSIDQGVRLTSCQAAEDARARYDRVTAGLDPPLAIVDLDAFDRNAAAMTRRAAGRPIRVATKSVRCRFLIERTLARPGYQGVMCYSLPEALWLHAMRTSDDLLVAYPTVDAGALRALAADETARQIATLFSGGYVASGTGNRNRLPRPYLPAGLTLTGVEGAGEVQTPVRGAAADRLRPGDRVWLRHAKAGELAERFNTYHLIHEDQVTAAPTYRGEGQCFG